MNTFYFSNKKSVFLDFQTPTLPAAPFNISTMESRDHNKRGETEKPDE
jgi:hypothetical protein